MCVLILKSYLPMNPCQKHLAGQKSSAPWICVYFSRWGHSQRAVAWLWKKERTMLEHLSPGKWFSIIKQACPKTTRSPEDIIYINITVKLVRLADCKAWRQIPGMLFFFHWLIAPSRDVAELQCHCPLKEILQPNFDPNSFKQSLLCGR